ncbi:MAG: peptidoglycan-binding protein, partial [Firmicutes bacterium]|nr:peptidoglycan-binding protein [Bacillota bacterium]
MVSNNRVAPTTDSRNVSRRRELRRRLAPALLAVALLALGLVSPGLAAAAGPGEVWLFKTASGPHVTMLQQSLSSVGLNPGPIDGVFGDQTLQAVRSFQVSRGLKSDGLVGPETSSFLADAVKSGLRILGLRVDHDPGSDSGGTTPPPPPLPPSDGTGGTTPGTPPAPPSGGTKPLAGKTVVLDPGHGGANPGAIGVNGIREAEINLNHALKVRDHLQAAGA